MSDRDNALMITGTPELANNVYPKNNAKTNASRYVVNSDRGVQELSTRYKCDTQSYLYKRYKSVVYSEKKNTAGEQAKFIAELILTMYDIVKLADSSIYYIGEPGKPYYQAYKTKEQLGSFITDIYHVFFGIGQGKTLQEVKKTVVENLGTVNVVSEIPKRYIKITGRYYWDKQEGEIYRERELDEETKVFARLFDTDNEDDMIFKIPEFTDEEEAIFLSVYNELKDTHFDDWGEQYRLSMFKDWSVDRYDYEYGMMTELALPYMKTMPRGSFINTGRGSNGKSVLNGLAISILGSNNTSIIRGEDIGKWDFRTDLQISWLNVAGENEESFLKTNAVAFKILSAHETYSIKRKYGDGSVPIRGDFGMIFNLNDPPVLRDKDGTLMSGSEAIFKRMYLISFDNQFPQDPTYPRRVFLQGRDEHGEPDHIIAKIVGMVFAFCHYFAQRGHTWEMKTSMIHERAALQDMLAPSLAFFSIVTPFCQGFRKIGVIKDDYVNYGNLLEIDGCNPKDIKLSDNVWKVFKRRDGFKGVEYRINDKGNVNRLILDDNSNLGVYTDYKTIKDYHEYGGSAFYNMEIDKNVFINALVMFYKNANMELSDSDAKEKATKLVLENMALTLEGRPSMIDRENSRVLIKGNWVKMSER